MGLRLFLYNNESTTGNGDASELGLPTRKGAALANVGAKIVNKSECVKRLGELSDKNASLFALLHTEYSKKTSPLK